MTDKEQEYRDRSLFASIYDDNAGEVEGLDKIDTAYFFWKLATRTAGRDEVIEECAKIVDGHRYMPADLRQIAYQIRQLKSKENT